MARPSVCRRFLSLLACLACLIGAALPVSGAQLPEVGLEAAAPVYYRASYSSTCIGYLAQGTPLTVLEAKGSFYKIDCYDMQGYIPTELVTEEQDEYYVNCPSTSTRAVLLQTRDVSQTQPLREQIAQVARKQLGIPYVYGGTTRRGFDCSGFTQYVYRKCGLTLTRTCLGQIGEGMIIPKEQLQCGDLVFFRRTTSSPNFVTHVGIYLGDGKMIHAGSSKGIAIVDLESDYYVKHYLCARRIIQTTDSPAPISRQISTAVVAATAGSRMPPKRLLTLEPATR